MTFPNSDLIDTGFFTQQSWRPMLAQQLSQTAGGVIRGSYLGETLWYTSLRTPPLTVDRALDFEAYLHSLNGVKNPFYFADLRRRYPKQYPTGAFTDSGTISAFPDGNLVAINNLPAGFVISRGDYFHIQSSGRRALLMCAEPITANGSGTTGAFSVVPELPVWISVGLSTVFKKPAAKMVLLPDSISQQSNTKFTEISFEAMAILY